MHMESVIYEMCRERQEAKAQINMGVVLEETYMSPQHAITSCDARYVVHNNDDCFRTSHGVLLTALLLTTKIIGVSMMITPIMSN